MTNTLALKKLPTPVRSLIRPMLFAALGLHALLLFAPLPSEQKPKKPDDKENPVKITQLPTVKPAATPRPKLAKPALPKVNRPKSAIVPPVQKPPAPRSKDPVNPSSDAKDPFADFPHYSPSTPNCYGKTDLGENCRETDLSFNALLAYFNKALADKAFDRVPAGGNGTTVKIFQVSKKGSKMTQYLSILKDGENKTTYLLAPQPIDSLDKLKKAEGIPKAIADLYDQLPTAGGGTNDATPGDFVQPDSYYKDPAASLPEQLGAIYGSPKVVDGSTADQIYATLKAYLSDKGYTAEPAETYGGGPLYEIKDASFTGYLNLATAKGGGVIVVVWTKKPG